VAPLNPDSLAVFFKRFPVSVPIVPVNAVQVVTRLVAAIPLALAPTTHEDQLTVVVEATKKKRKTKVAHPMGHSFQSMPLPTEGSIFSMLSSISRNVSSHMWDMCVESSKATYQSGLNHFNKYVALLGTNVTMTKIPAEFYQIQQLSNLSVLSWFLIVMLGFMTYLRMNVGVTPHSVDTYISGVRFFLINMNVDVSQLDNHPMVKATRSGINKAWRALPGNSKAANQTLPFSCDMIIRVRNELCHSLSPQRQSRLELATATALIFAFILLARISEYIVTESNHHILGNDIIFVLNVPDSNGTTISIPSSEAHKFDINDLVEMYATIKDSKNDPDGAGHKFNYSKQPSDGPSLICLASEMFRCAQVLRPDPTTAFFAFRGDHSERAWSLGQHAFNATVKDGAKLYGFNGDRFSSHSIRIGGASALAAAGAPSWVIQLTGRWKSLAFLQYIRLASTQFQRSIELQTDGTTFTAKHIEMWSPAHQYRPPTVL
jgi:hypothetical protein